jgi:hypothetical protein
MMTFGEAIKELDNGNKVRRSGWNGKGMYLWKLNATTVPIDCLKEPFLKQIATENGGAVECLASIRMFTADRKVLTGWLASQTDIFATDWEMA